MLNNTFGFLERKINHFTDRRFRQTAYHELLRLEDEDDDESEAEAEGGRHDPLLQLHPLRVSDSVGFLIRSDRPFSFPLK